MESDVYLEEDPARTARLYWALRDDLHGTAVNTLLNQDQKAIHVDAALRRFLTRITCLDLYELQAYLRATTL